MIILKKSQIMKRQFGPLKTHRQEYTHVQEIRKTLNQEQVLKKSSDQNKKY